MGLIDNSKYDTKIHWNRNVHPSEAFLCFVRKGLSEHDRANISPTYNSYRALMLADWGLILPQNALRPWQFDDVSDRLFFYPPFSYGEGMVIKEFSQTTHFWQIAKSRELMAWTNDRVISVSLKEATRDQRLKIKLAYNVEA